MTDTFTCLRCGMGGIEDDAAHSEFHERIGDPLPAGKRKPDPLVLFLYQAGYPQASSRSPESLWEYGSPGWEFWHRIAEATRMYADEKAAAVLAEAADRPWLGLATTRELLLELRSRIEVTVEHPEAAQGLYNGIIDAFTNMPAVDLDYRTISGDQG